MLTVSNDSFDLLDRIRTLNIVMGNKNGGKFFSPAADNSQHFNVYLSSYISDMQ